MINAIKNKYYTYDPNEFMPIFYDGKLANGREFHLLKLKHAAYKLDALWVKALDRAYGK